MHQMSTALHSVDVSSNEYGKQFKLSKLGELPPKVGHSWLLHKAMGIVNADHIYVFLLSIASICDGYAFTHFFGLGIATLSTLYISLSLFSPSHSQL